MRRALWAVAVGIPVVVWVAVYVMARHPTTEVERPCLPQVARVATPGPAEQRSPDPPSPARSSTPAPRPVLVMSSVASDHLDSADPASPDYDAAATFNARPGPPDALFAREPRDESWATARETAIRDMVLANVRAVDQDAVFDVECRTATCLVHLRTQNPMLAEWKTKFPLGCLVNTYATMVGDDPEPDFYLLFDHDGRSDEGWRKALETCAARRDEWLAGMRAGRPPW